MWSIFFIHLLLIYALRWASIEVFGSCFFFLIKLFTFLLLSFAVLCFHEGQHVWKSLSRVLLWPILFTNLCTCHTMAIFSSFNFKLVSTVTREHTFHDACSFQPVRLARVLGTELQVYFCFHVSPHLNILLCPLLSFLVTENKSDKTFIFVPL